MSSSQGITPTVRYRKVRFVCISDTHNQTLRLPRGDVLIHAGDLTNQGSFSELSRTVQWLEKADFEAKLVIAGNHDVTLDKDFYAEFGSYFHNQSPQSVDECLQLLKDSPSITYLNHEAATIKLAKHPNLPTSFTVFGSPYSPRVGMWAFSYDKQDGVQHQYSTNEIFPSASAHPPSSSSGSSERPNKDKPKPKPKPLTGVHLWSAIPLDTDIVITHTPPHTHCDESVTKRRAFGCEDLRRTLWRVRPKLAVCGHVHEGRGAERVRWDVLGVSGAPYSELGTTRWTDPGAGAGNNKMSLLNLSSRGGGKEPLDHDNSSLAGGAQKDDDDDDDDTCICQQHFSSHEDEKSNGDGAARPGMGTRGVGGDPRVSPRCDVRALCCRLGRRETCVVNCAIAATNWPHTGGKKFNKPIVIDLDLPILEKEASDS